MNALEPHDVGIGKLFERMPDAVIVIDCATGCIVLWNPAAVTLFGYSVAEAVGQSIEMIVPAELRDAHRAGLARYAATGHGQLVDGQVPLVLPALRQSGERITVELTLSPLEGPNISTRVVLAIVRDLSERIRAEEARAAEQAAIDLNQRMDTFVGIASHELMTPITALRGNLQLAARRLEQLAEPHPDLELGPLQTVLSRALTASDRLELLVRDLLDVTRIQANKLEMRVERIDLVALTRHVVEEQQALLGTTYLDLDLPDAPAWVEADPYRILQVVTNYLTNALKHGAARQVTVGLAIEATTARLSVRDQGPGVPAAVLAHVWDRFFQVDKKRGTQAGRPGLGLGLYICKTIIELHGGAVGVESVPGQGATFWFTLPLLNAPA